MLLQEIKKANMEALKTKDTSLYPKRHGSEGYSHMKEDKARIKEKNGRGKFLPCSFFVLK